MTCREYQNELALYAGVEMLPPELAGHLNDCADCRTFYEELTDVTAKLGSDADFSDLIDEEAFVSSVERRIGTVETPEPVKPWWQKALPYAAAIALVAGISWVSVVVFDGDTPQQANVVDQDEQILSSIYAEEETAEFDETSFELILTDYTAQDRFFESSERLLDDLSDEELQYLQENFDVRELL